MFTVQAHYPEHTPQLSGMSVRESELVVCVSYGREESVAVLHIPNGRFKKQIMGGMCYRDGNPVPINSLTNKHYVHEAGLYVLKAIMYMSSMVKYFVQAST